MNYFNEIHAVWEPLIERIDGGARRWNLELEVCVSALLQRVLFSTHPHHSPLQIKNNPVQDKSPIHGDDFVILPDPRTAVNICSKDIMNITVSQSSLNVFYNLAKVTTPLSMNKRLQLLSSETLSDIVIFFPLTRRFQRALAPTMFAH